MRKHNFVAGNYYHIYIHGISNIALFKNERDYIRFMNILFLANRESTLPRMDRSSDLNLVWGVKNEKLQPIIKIVSFCLMPNHLHFILGENRDGNISKYMHKMLVSYAKYFNKKYQRRGHLFESSFNSKLLSDNNYLLRASAYIHQNPHSLKGHINREHKYTWSSFQDYVTENRWGDLLSRDIILSQFKSEPSDSYLNFVKESKNRESFMPQTS